jgi:hypothetical protein
MRHQSQWQDIAFEIMKKMTPTQDIWHSTEDEDASVHSQPTPTS